VVNELEWGLMGFNGVVGVLLVLRGLIDGVIPGIHGGLGSHQI